MPVAGWAGKQVLPVKQASPIVFQVPFAFESVPSDKAAYYLLLETLQQNSIFLQTVSPDCYDNSKQRLSAVLYYKLKTSDMTRISV